MHVCIMRCQKHASLIRVPGSLNGRTAATPGNAAGARTCGKIERPACHFYYSTVRGISFSQVATLQVGHQLVDTSCVPQP